jgi:hypothetical protein
MADLGPVLVTGVTGLAGIVVSGIVGPWFSARRAQQQQAAEFQHERNLTDLAELRRVLDGAWDRIGEVTKALVDLRRQRAHPSLPPEALQRLINEYSDRRTRANNWIHTIAMRVGAEHPVSVSYVRCIDGLAALGRALEDQPENFDLPEYREVQSAQDSFAEVASNLVGAELAHPLEVKSKTQA